MILLKFRPWWAAIKSPFKNLSLLSENISRKKRHKWEQLQRNSWSTATQKVSLSFIRSVLNSQIVSRTPLVSNLEWSSCLEEGNEPGCELLSPSCFEWTIHATSKWFNTNHFLELLTFFFSPNNYHYFLSLWWPVFYFLWLHWFTEAQLDSCKQQERTC